ncbi:crossover junction endodeoxyribonuclease RuvC [Nonomuraea sp. SYSU D8015]|uniref:crossover junction endodeoxyribonuclease RuvC n=1 Tax=Nonomuraea sp. SYSU D8015 TaxID=2593644 RepID=UPI001660F7F0|nr:crossover junction endodeoxyribonuclease RuvC [Nonomuraea sp. SYSU D8015]
MITSPPAGQPPRVAGLDQAAEKTGLALPDGRTCLITAPKAAGKTRTYADDMRRADHVERDVVTSLLGTGVQAVGIEDYAFSKRSSATHRLAEIGGAVRLACWRYRIAVAVINVKHLKMYATGKGGASKHDMAAAAYEYAGASFRSFDECDAAWARWLVLDLLGHPAFPLPTKHRRVLAQIQLYCREGW